VTAGRVLKRYDEGGGGLLAGGLAYAALFAIVPAVLLAVGLAGLVIGDPARRTAATDLIVAIFPPLRGLVEAAADQVALEAGPISIVGAATLMWGASRLAVAFDDAVARVFGGTRRRGLVRRNVGAVGTVLLLVGGLLGLTMLAGLAAFVDAGQAAGVVPVLGLLVDVTLELLPAVTVAAAMTLVYRVLPLPRPTWRAALPPGIVIGLVLAVLARLFVFLAPRLIGAAALLGGVATVFAALAWLALSFQAILIGAAWVGDRSSRGSTAPDSGTS
jgi:membrane protein